MIRLSRWLFRRNEQSTNPLKNESMHLLYAMQLIGVIEAIEGDITSYIGEFSVRFAHVF